MIQKAAFHDALTGTASTSLHMKHRLQALYRMLSEINEDSIGISTVPVSSEHLPCATLMPKIVGICVMGLAVTATRSALKKWCNCRDAKSYQCFLVMPAIER